MPLPIIIIVTIILLLLYIWYLIEGDTNHGLRFFSTLIVVAIYLMVTWISLYATRDPEYIDLEIFDGGDNQYVILEDGTILDITKRLGVIYEPGTTIKYETSSYGIWADNFITSYKRDRKIDE